MDILYWNRLASGYDKRAERFQKVYDQLIGLIKPELSHGDSLLDIGTGTGAIPILLSGYLREVKGIDLSEAMIGIARKKAETLKLSNVSFEVGNSYHLEIPDKCYDAVLISHLLHIVDNPIKVIQEAIRVLKDDGKLMIATYLHGYSIKTKLLSWMMKLTGHPVYHRFNENSLISLMKSMPLKLDEKKVIRNILPVIFIVMSKNEN